MTSEQSAMSGDCHISQEPDVPGRMHWLKTVQPFYDEVESGRKTVEVRLNDRSFAVGDTLVLWEYDPLTGGTSGRWMVRLVTHVVSGEEWGLISGYVALSITDRLTALDSA